MWRFLTIVLIIVLIGSLVVTGGWVALRGGLPFFPIEAASPATPEAAPAEVQAPPKLESPVESLSAHSARASLGHMAAISVTLQLPTASGAIVSVTVPVEVELGLEVAVSGGRAGLLGYQQKSVPVVEVQPLLAKHMLTTASNEEILRPAQAVALVPTPTPQRLLAPTPQAPASVEYNVNMRSEPDAASPIVGKIHPGDAFALVARSTDSSWYRVMHEDGTTGWIAAYLVQGGPAPETLTVAALDAPLLLGAVVTPVP